jgi:hypothetical protein
MRADFETGRGLVLQSRRRRPRAQLFSPSGRQIVIALGLAAVALAGFGLFGPRPSYAPAAAPAWIGR